MKRSFVVIAVILVAIGAVAGALFGRLQSSASAGTAITSERIAADYREALDVVGENYSGKADRENVSDSSIQGMLWSLDPHSSFFTREEFERLSQEQASQFYGIGVSIFQRRDGVYVQSIVPGTPAETAGLRYGDRITQVDGKDATEWTSNEVSKNVRGERGTTVKVKVERANSATPIVFDIVRGGVPLPSIRNYFMLPNGVGYVGLTGGFQETTAEELNEALEDLDKQGMKSLILDLRNNPGGILEQAVAVVSRFVPTDQTVVSVKGRTGQSLSRELKSSGKDVEKLPLVVMMNGGSASASEIVAGAIQDYGRGVVVGTDSFGKGLVQRVFRLPYGTGMTLTTARYYTPFGRSLQRDYSSGSIYDYYANHDEDSAEAIIEPKPVGIPVTLPDGRTLFGGRGIEPDVKAKPQEFSTQRARINDAAFFFVRQLVAGKVPGFESYKVEKQSQVKSIQPGALSVTDRLFEAFRQITLSDKENGLAAENIASDVEYAKTRLRQELVTANYSNEAGVQVLLETDPQILKATESIAVARNMVEKNLAMRK
ncbi:MAG TPA: S41 family peptidase [Pyrinomonadaceae bacterium]|jgi:carboxyl-terminal processing protease|nr:S41 family peptidase [Pyrinomonadaceae bacterium]